MTRNRGALLTVLAVELVALVWYVGGDVLRALGVFGPPVDDFASGLSPVVTLPGLLGIIMLPIAIVWIVTGARRIHVAGRGALRLLSLLHVMVIVYMIAVSSIGFRWSYLAWTVGISAAAAVGANIAWRGARMNDA